jgi:hypothetical protein
MSVALTPYELLLDDQTLERLHILSVIAWLIDWRLGNKRGMSKPGLVQEPAKRFETNGAATDMLVTIKLGATRRLGIIAVPDANTVVPHGRIKLS